MAVSRPFLVALLGAVLVAVLFLVMGRASTGDSGQASPPAAEEAAKPPEEAVKTAKPAAKAKRRAVAAASSAKGEARPAARAQAKPKSQPAPAGVPSEVVRALARKRTVVLFFRQRGSADDDATAQAVASQRGRPGVSVFSAPISRLADYRAIAGEAGVSQAPAVVVVGRKGARLIEGYVDSETLAQEVADSR